MRRDFNVMDAMRGYPIRNPEQNAVDKAYSEHMGYEYEPDEYDHEEYLAVKARLSDERHSL